MSSEKLLIGLLQPYDEKKADQMIKEKIPVILGVSLENLYNHLNFLEVQHSNNKDLVLSHLKHSLMLTTGLILEEEQDAKIEEKNV